MTILSDYEMLIVTGKGGVGKSVISAALASLLSSVDRHVLLIETDPRENLHQLLDVVPSAGEVVSVASHLDLQHLHPRSVLDELVAEKLKFGPLARKVLASPVHQHFAEGAPGLKETALLGRVLRLLDGNVPKGQKKPATVVMDAPASGHSVAMLTAPELVSSVISSGPVGHMADQIAALVHDSQRSASVLVTLAEEMPVQETIELIDNMRDSLDQEPACVIVNGLYPELPESQAQSSDRNSELIGLRQLLQARRSINQVQLERLVSSWHGPLFTVPLIQADRGPDLVNLVCSNLQTQAGLA